MVISPLSRNIQVFWGGTINLAPEKISEEVPEKFDTENKYRTGKILVPSHTGVYK